ncbi:MAG TPA: phosphotransferase [Candidatus Angelobacter sp.]|nr:phosphotransferase [Candidatus Angelobacter sp.]
MTTDELIEAFLGTKEAFEAALTRVRSASTGELLVLFFQKLDSDSNLENSERERRFNSVFTRSSIALQDFPRLADVGAKASNPVLKNALIQLLPPEYRGLIYRSSKSGGIENGTPIIAINQLPVSQETTPQPATLANSVEGFSDVIVLSIVDDPATKKLLEGAQFVPLRCTSVIGLQEMTTNNNDICAFLVESSFLSSLDHAKQTELIETLAKYSTFAWLRFQEDALLQNNVEVGQLVARVRCRTSHPEFTDVSFRDKAGLQERELPLLQEARRRLTAGESHGLFTPGELTGSELRLLGAAMSQYSKRRRFNPRAELTHVTTKFLQGGQTGARVALVKVNDLRVPVIIKLDQKSFILEEAKRFLTFIQKDNPDLNPEVHLHADAALIVFGIIPSTSGESEEPAPTLEHCLTDVWFQEIQDPTHSHGTDVLLEGFRDAARRLANLNKQRCSDFSFSCRANPFLDSVKKMEGSGFSLGFDANIIEKRRQAEELFAAAGQHAICHGDAHTKNILIRREQGFLIDYALSGPGHPCVDLVRLELSIYLSRFFQFDEDQKLVSLQRDLSVQQLPVAELVSRHKEVIRSKTNELCLRLCVVARDLAAEVLKAHKLSWDHYLATKLLFSWQALLVPNLQHALTRQIILALS